MMTILSMFVHGIDLKYREDRVDHGVWSHSATDVNPIEHEPASSAFMTQGTEQLQAHQFRLTAIFLLESKSY